MILWVPSLAKAIISMATKPPFKPFLPRGRISYIGPMAPLRIPERFRSSPTLNIPPSLHPKHIRFPSSPTTPLSVPFMEPVSTPMAKRLSLPRWLSPVPNSWVGATALPTIPARLLSPATRSSMLFSAIWWA